MPAGPYASPVIAEVRHVVILTDPAEAITRWAGTAQTFIQTGAALIHGWNWLAENPYEISDAQAQQAEALTAHLVEALHTDPRADLALLLGRLTPRMAGILHTLAEAGSDELTDPTYRDNTITAGDAEGALCLIRHLIHESKRVTGHTLTHSPATAS